MNHSFGSMPSFNGSLADGDEVDGGRDINARDRPRRVTEEEGGDAEGGETPPLSGTARRLRAQSAVSALSGEEWGREEEDEDGEGKKVLVQVRGIEVPLDLFAEGEDANTGTVFKFQGVVICEC